MDIIVGNNHVLTVTPGNVCGEHALLTGRRRNACAICASEGYLDTVADDWLAWSFQCNFMFEPFLL